jgi:hypothetical protein
MSGRPSESDWVAAAAKSRATADAMQDPVLREAMLMIAIGYERMAQYTATLAFRERGIGAN